MDIANDIYIHIAKQCDPLTRAHWMMAYPNIFKKELRDYLRIDSAKNMRYDGVKM